MADDGVAVTTGRQVSREPYRGRYRTNRQTGERQVWNGTQYVPETASTLAPEAADAIGKERSELNRLSQAAILGQQFLGLNAQQATGSLARQIPLLRDVLPANNAAMQQMENIQNSRVFDYMRGGAAGGGVSAQAANTPQEQARLERTGPTILNTGPANRAIVLNAQIDRDLQDRRVSEMEAWARNPRNRSLEGFAQFWAQNAPRFRAEIQRRYEATNGPVNSQADFMGRQRPNPAPAPRRISGDEEFRALPSGTLFVGPDGVTRRKP